MSAAAELRRRAAAARVIHRYPTTAERLEDRRQRALGTLTAALGADDAATVPGFKITRTPDGIAVEAQAPTHVDQLALWSTAA